MLVYCGQTVGWMKMKLGMEVGLDSHIVPDGDPAPPKEGAQPSPNFRPMSVVSKRLDGLRCHLVWTMEVGLGPGDIVLDGDQLPLERSTGASPLLGPCLVWPNGRPSQLLLSTCY